MCLRFLLLHCQLLLPGVDSIFLCLSVSSSVRLSVLPLSLPLSLHLTSLSLSLLLYLRFIFVTVTAFSSVCLSLSLFLSCPVGCFVSVLHNCLIDPAASFIGRGRIFLQEREKEERKAFPISPQPYRTSSFSRSSLFPSAIYGWSQTLAGDKIVTRRHVNLTELLIIMGSLSL